jgi:ATP dependent DNA ligase domain
MSAATSAGVVAWLLRNSIGAPVERSVGIGIESSHRRGLDHARNRRDAGNVRPLILVIHSAYRLVNRHGRERTEQYPEFGFLRQLPAGTLLDGEMVVLVGGKPAFGKLLTREQTQDPLKVRMLARSLPAVYVVFDILYAAYEPVLDQPLERRRERLQKLVEDQEGSGLVFSTGVVGEGRRSGAGESQKRASPLSLERTCVPGSQCRYANANPARPTSIVQCRWR